MAEQSAGRFDGGLWCALTSGRETRSSDRGNRLGQVVGSERLAARGALIIDADEVVKELQRPVSRSSGHGRAMGRQDLGRRRHLGPRRRRRNRVRRQGRASALNKMVHPAVELRCAAIRRAVADRWRVVLDIPLLVEGGSDRRGASAVIVVDLPARDGHRAADGLPQLRREPTPRPGSRPRPRGRSGWRPPTS